MDSRDEILALLGGARIGRLPVFGVLPSLTAKGIASIGARYSELHTDAAKMAVAAATTFQIYGWESAVVPFDLCVEAEALGCSVDFQTDVEFYVAPTIQISIVNYQLPLTHSDYLLPDASRAGRIPIVADAIRHLKKKVGLQVLVGAVIPGPFTLAWQMFGGEDWLTFVGAKDSSGALLRLAEWLPSVAHQYRDAGADFVTVHEMGGSPQVIGAERFRSIVKPALQKLFARLPSPTVLSVCGDTNAVVQDLAECGANAINVDQRNNLARTRQILGSEAILFGNLDPVGVLSRGSATDVRRAVAQIVNAHASAIVPGCDLYPEIPDENMRALIESSRHPMGDRVARVAQNGQ
jgi:MtaA/CmuA family methyltransferase